MAGSPALPCDPPTPSGAGGQSLPHSRGDGHAMGAQVGLVGLAVMGQNLALEHRAQRLPDRRLQSDRARGPRISSRGRPLASKFTGAVHARRVRRRDRPAAQDHPDGPGRQGRSTSRSPGSSRCWRTATSWPTPATRCSRTPSAAARSLTAAASTTSGWASAAARRARSGARASCPGGSKESYAALAPILTAIAAKSALRRLRDATSGRAAPATTSRWSTTASSTATCS